MVVVEGFTFDDEVFYLDGDGSGKTVHCCGEIFICLDLEDAFNGLQGHSHLAVVGDPFGISRHPEELLRVHIVFSEGANEVQRVLTEDGTLFGVKERQDVIVDPANGGFERRDILFWIWISKVGSGGWWCGGGCCGEDGYCRRVIRRCRTS